MQTDLASFRLTFAQADVPSAGAPAGPPQTPTQGAPTGQPQGQTGPMGGGFIWIMLAVMLGLVLMTSMTGRKDKKRREQMLSTLKRNDRVQTIGGVIGTVLEFRNNNSEVILRTDEATDTRITCARAAIQQVLREGKGGTELEPKPDRQAAST